MMTGRQQAINATWDEIAARVAVTRAHGKRNCGQAAAAARPATSAQQAIDATWDEIAAGVAVTAGRGDRRRRT
ncbi:MAG: hypothetical protein WDN04_14925 [Rhodospirillales bacterium]